MNVVATPISLDARSPSEKPWSRWMWLLVVLLVCIGQFGLIFLLGARHPIRSAVPWPAPPMTLVGDKSAALVELTDPTIFVLPSRHGFSGAARAITPRNQFVATDWTEPFRWLDLSPDKLGESFQALLATDTTPPVQIAEKTEPRSTTLIAAPVFALPTQSTLRIQGDLAGRDVVSTMNLPSWPSADILKHSRVQVVVDASGRVVSAALLGSSDLAEADQRALELARAARFEPSPGADLVWGQLFFDWHTIPLPTADETAVPQPLP